MTAALDRVVILAGGGGTRLWPWTGPRLPKPLLPLGGAGRTLLAAALERAQAIAPAGAVAVQAVGDVGQLLAAGEPRLAHAQMWAEPSARDTGPAIALAMRRIVEEDPQAIVLVCPADQRIEDRAAFASAVALAATSARAGALTLLGIKPDRPATTFGYIELGSTDRAGVRQVARFVEKPDAARAEEFVATGRYVWNAGIFVWQAAAFWSALQAHAPDLASAVADFARTGERARWEAAPRTSIDYALMEKAERVAVVPLDAGWDDIGGWDAVLRLAERSDAPAVTILPLRGETPGRSVALAVGGATPRAIVIGAEPLLVVSGPEGVLVVPRDGLDRVKRFV